ncbi:solute carrier family 12 member 3-like [Oppia nitens]|uniref:solute carrier family 12 member 3-like n=1 Tax=Oppia nitens TaxID=1686743 RepID=UPI0023DA6736|nr:solute carrier family 12 member 3-like [Oppia nitens]
MTKYIPNRFQQQNGGHLNAAYLNDLNDDSESTTDREFSNYIPSSSVVLPEFLKNLATNRQQKNSRNNNLELTSNVSPETDANMNVITDVIPHEDFYRRDNTIHKKSRRPDIEELHLPYNLGKKSIDGDNNEDSNVKSTKLGWIDGVYIRTMMNLFGVMLFLRMGWMAGQAGVILALVQILVATTITVVTTTSMIAMCTNGNIGGGGIYSMVSRTVGHEAGGVIGFMFTFTNAAFVGLNVLGTAESVSDILNAFNTGICQVPSETNDQRIIGYICLIIIAAIPIISLEFESKTMMFFFLTLVVSLIDYFVGSFIPPTELQQSQGLAYWHKYVIVPNLFPRWDGSDFFGVFGVFFPSVTGIFTGASMSADLKEPASAIIKGTFMAIATTSTTYSIIVIFLGFTIVAYSDGNAASIIFNNQTCEAANNCPFGLINNFQTMALTGAISQTGIKIEPLIYAGIFAATLSSALGCYTAAPRIFQAFCDDHLVPVITWFGKGYGPSRDPRHGYIITFIIAAIFVAIGDVNTAGVWISNFYLGAFFIVNISLFHVSMVNPISFRPGFRFYNKWISLIIGLFCVALMFLFDYISAAVVSGLIIIIYLLMFFVDPSKANWGSSTEACCFDCARSLTFRLNKQEDHIKSYRPIVLLLSGNPKNRQVLVDMANRITKGHGMLFLSHVTEGPLSYKTRERVIDSQRVWIKSERINAFYKLIESEFLSDGIRNQMHSTGVGKFTPNIVMLGYKSDWRSAKDDDLRDYYDVIHNVLEAHYSLVMFRVKEGLDFSDHFVATFNNSLTVNRMENNGEIYSISSTMDSNTNETTTTKTPMSHMECHRLANRFKYKQSPGFIDVWWLYDDGGLSLLIPYILINDKLWQKCRLRVFTVAEGNQELNVIKNNLSELLKKFRIPFADVYALSYDDVELSIETKRKFDSILENRIMDDITPIIKTSPKELFSFKEQTTKTMKLRELMVKYSTSSTLITLTLPIPRKYKCSATLYMSWLEVLTYDMPPLLLIRGNQKSVLTFYC